MPLQNILLTVTIFLIIYSLKKQKKIMGKLEQIQGLLSGINESTNNIAADLERIAGGLSGGLTSEQADTVIADLQAAADKLKAVADTTPEDEAPEEPGA